MTERLHADVDETARLDRSPEAPDRLRVARVNLLPAEYSRERRRRRLAGIAVGVLVLYVVALAVIYAVKLEAVSDARAERDATEGEVAVLRAEAESLREFQTLATQLETREALLTAAMADELSWARVLGDLALVFSPQSSLTAVQAVTTGADAAVEGATATATATTPDGQPVPGAPAAQITFSGYSIDRFAPGVQDVLDRFRGERLFAKPYLSTAVEEERGAQLVTTFEGRVDLNDEAFTHRYDDGLPEESIQ